MDNGYYVRGFHNDRFNRMNQQGNGNNMMGIMGPGADAMAASGIVGGQSLDDIVQSNAKEIRRRSVPVSYGSGASGLDQDMRRVSMMDFGSGTGGVGPLDGFQFDMSTTSSMEGIIPSRDAISRPNGADSGRRQSAVGLALNTQFANQATGYDPMPAQGSSYASPLQNNGAVDIDMSLNSPFHIPSSMPMALDLNDPALATMMSPDVPPISAYSQPDYDAPMMNSPLNQSFIGNMQMAPPDPGGGGTSETNDQFNVTDHHSSATPEIRPSLRSSSNSNENSAQVGSRTSSQPSSAQSTQRPTPTLPLEGPALLGEQAVNNFKQNRFPWKEPPGKCGSPGVAHRNTAIPRSSSRDSCSGSLGGFPSALHNRPHQQSEQFKNIYSSSGFDMLGVLMRVATRANPEINIGNVDMSCAFVVCDVTLDDCPIVYCSENFERLTGYTQHMIKGRNCRFLQSPDGKVEAGIRRKYVDDDSVLYLKNMISMRREAQISLINYRRGGQPFMNLLTMIPISWDFDNPEIRYFVGFQVDLVERPDAVNNKNSDGSYSVNYQRHNMPRYIMSTPENTNHMDLGQTISRDDVSTVLSTIGAGESELSKRIWDKVLLENTDDVVHVLSLKGLFLYLSPSSRKVLEYEASELVGTALSAVCHPSDIVPVTRELKDTSSGAPVNVVFRIRRKQSGYMWFESHGSLHTEQGKGRKCIILVGRERPVYTLGRSDLVSQGGIGDSELWSKMSTSGCFLFVSSNVRALLDKQPDELLGTSIQALMRPDSKQEFARILELARSGKKSSVKHEMINRRGQVLQAFTTIYPGDAVEGQKPTFLIAQTKLLKFARGGNHSSQRSSIYPKLDRENSIPSNASTANTGLSGGNTGDTTPQTRTSGSHLIATDRAPTTYAGQHGLAIGRQDASLASEENVFDELKTTRSTSWQYELRQMERRNRILAEEVQSLLAAKKKRKRRKGAGQLQKDCANCHTKETPEWRRGPSGNRDLCNSCGLRWAKQNGRVSPRTPSQQSVQSAHSEKGNKPNASPVDNKTMLTHSNPTGGPSASSIQETKNTLTNAESHASKVARMEIAGSQGYSSGIPAKIDEGIEPE